MDDWPRIVFSWNPLIELVEILNGALRSARTLMREMEICHTSSDGQIEFPTVPDISKTGDKEVPHHRFAGGICKQMILDALLDILGYPICITRVSCDKAPDARNAAGNVLTMLRSARLTK